MDYKLISCDLDGTLLDDDKNVEKRIIDRINDLVKMGVWFVIATGRPCTGTKRYIDLLDKDMPVILYNGSVIRMGKSNKLLFNEFLNEEDAFCIIKRIKEHNGTYIFWRNEVPYVNKTDDYITSYVKISKVEPMIDDEKNYKDITKIIWFNDKDKLKEYEKTMFNDLDDVNCFTSMPTYLEFVNKKASKEKALEKVCELLNIKKEEVIAIGEGNNDTGMIKFARIGVAMENASAEVKKCADIIVPSNNDGGVMEVLNTYFKK